MRNKSSTSGKLESRVVDLERRLGRHHMVTVVTALIAAVLGGSGVIGALQLFYDAPLKEVEVRARQLDNKLKEIDVKYKALEELSKEMKQFQGHYLDTVESFKRQLDALSSVNDLEAEKEDFFVS